MTTWRNPFVVSGAVPTESFIGRDADVRMALSQILTPGNLARANKRQNLGRDYAAVPCLNDHPTWLDAMTRIAERELAGWTD